MARALTRHACGRRARALSFSRGPFASGGSGPLQNLAGVSLID